MTIAEITAALTRSLQAVSDAPSIDADRIVLAALKQQEPSYLLSHSNEAVSLDAQKEIQTMEERRKLGMPLAYVLGEAGFYGRIFTVTQDVLIPRPDTEALIDKALFQIPRISNALNRPIVVADIGTGSGCIAITLALELSVALKAISYKLLASDISPAALIVAKENAKRHNVTEKIQFLEGDMLAPYQDIPIDLIVSNPPYVPSSEIDDASTSPNTIGLLFEPRLALDGGQDGLTFVHQIQASGIPALIETIGGEIIEFGL